MPLLDFIVSHRAEILTATVYKLQLNHPGIGGFDLLGDLGGFVDLVIRTLGDDEQARVPSSPDASRLAQAHGEQRFRILFDPGSLAQDYGTVCDVVYEHAGRAHLTLSPREVQVFNHCIDSASSDALTAFWHQDRVELRRGSVEQLGVLAHELRNALGSAEMAFALIQSGRAPIEGRSADVVLRAFVRMKELIARALTDVRAGAPSAHFERTRCRLDQLMQQVRDGAVATQGRRLVGQDWPDFEVDVDVRLLGSALGNLVQNALKFTHSNGAVQLRAFEDGINLKIEVEDECGGLPPGAADELFQPFVQKDHDRSGIGLGLAIAHEAVRAHGGHIDVRDLPGKGCVFCVTLPSVIVRPVPALRTPPSIPT